MDDKNDQPGMIRHYRRLAKRIVQHHFGTPASRIVYKPSGRTNYVFAVNHVDGQFVVRMSPDPNRIEAFQKELWASQKVREAGVPSPEVIAVGNDVAAEPYMITRRVTGTEATHHQNRQRIIHSLGNYAALINSISTYGFGIHFDWTNQEQAQADWTSYLRNEFQLERRIELFTKHRMLPESELDELVKILSEPQNSRVSQAPGPKPSLNHSDLRLKNVIVDEGGDIAAIIDWEDCLSTIAPEWDLSIALHDLSIDEKQIFIEGYGLSSREVEDMSPLIKAFNLINYSQAVEIAAARQDQKQLTALRTRLQGSLDLYSPIRVRK